MDAVIRPILERGLATLGIAPPDGAIDKLLTYARLLVERNRAVNLTAITEPEEVATLHFLDCAAVLTCAELAGKSLIDVGTGAGFPGLVLRILEPSLKLTLLDASQKRLDFLTEVCETLGLEDVSILHARAEEGGIDPALREGFDYATARALAALPLLCELCVPYVRPSGYFLAMKAADCGEEIASAETAAAKLGARIAGRADYRVPFREIDRCIVLLEKTSPTPAKYPRRWTKIQKVPL